MSQFNLFEDEVLEKYTIEETDPEWKSEWVGMPDFYVPTRDTEERNKIDVSDVKIIAKRETKIFPKYPIYIISKGRWEKPLTAKSLEKMGIDYRIVVEPSEYKNYCKEISNDKILVLPFDNLGEGSIPARNWVWEHSISRGYGKHWILDDNINGFGYQKGGRRINAVNGDMFAQCEDFVDRYKNIAMAGIRYRFHHNYVKSPYYLNTRIYSCILLDNNITERWRGRFNEDTDLSLRLLKKKHCTILFTWCYCNKAGTMSMKGGNTDTVYKDTNNRKEFAESLKEQHPDVVDITWKFNRWHHQVNYQPFKNNNLIRK